MKFVLLTTGIIILFVAVVLGLWLMVHYVHQQLGVAPLESDRTAFTE